LEKKEYFGNFSGKLLPMEEQVLSASEVAEYGEFKRVQREREVALTLRRLVIDVSRREHDRAAIKRACESAKNLNAAGITVSPVNTAFARKLLPKKQERRPSLIVTVGGTGESLIAVKKTETKKSVRQGADGVRLIPCYSALLNGEFNYIRREAKTVRRAVKHGTFVLALDDGAIRESEIVRGVKAAVAAHADGVSVRGETDLALAAIEAAEGRLFVEAEGIQNAAQLRILLRAGVMRAATDHGEKLAQELRNSLKAVQNDEQTADESAKNR